MKLPFIFLVVLLMSLFGCSESKEQTPVANASNSDRGLPMLKVYTTAKDTDLRLTLTGSETFSAGSQPPETVNSIFVNPDKKFQEVLGFGGSITDASAEVFAKMPAEKQEEFLTAYFDKEEGIGYTLSLIHI